MSCHLAHKLPWESVLEIYVAHKDPDTPKRTCPPKAEKLLKHFASRFVQLLQEFQATDTSTVEEIEEIDPKRWGDYEFTMGGTYMGYYHSLFWGYFELNLLLMDPERVAPLMMPDGRLTWALGVLCGSYSGGHPDNLAHHLNEEFKDRKLNEEFKDTPALLKVLRDHAALMFRCMYSVTGENKLLDVPRMTSIVFGFFGWYTK